jgi:hypothetical protein
MLFLPGYFHLDLERLRSSHRVLTIVPMLYVIASPRAVILVSNGFLLGGATAQADSDALVLPFGTHRYAVAVKVTLVLADATI